MMNNSQGASSFFSGLSTLLGRPHPLLHNLSDTTIYTVRNVCVLGSGSAITSGYNTRTRSDGGIISVEGVAYMLTKAPQGWRIAAFSATTPELVIRCEDE